MNRWATEALGRSKPNTFTAELVSLAPSVAPGSSVDLGLVLSLEEHWHVYWINAGDSGEPPAIKWTLPEGVTAGPIQFPVPSRLPLGPLMDFGYEDNTAFPVKISVAPFGQSWPNTPSTPRSPGWYAAKYVFPGKLTWASILPSCPTRQLGPR